jgi:hypothetical protein
MTDVPTTLGAVLDPGWLRHALDDVDQDDRIIEVDEIDSSQTLAQKVRFLVTVERADGARRTRAYCVKAHLDGSPGTDLLSEARFYGELPMIAALRATGLLHRPSTRRPQAR